MNTIMIKLSKEKSRIQSNKSQITYSNALNGVTESNSPYKRPASQHANPKATTSQDARSHFFDTTFFHSYELSLFLSTRDKRTLLILSSMMNPTPPPPLHLLFTSCIPLTKVSTPPSTAYSDVVGACSGSHHQPLPSPSGLSRSLPFGSLPSATGRCRSGA